MFAQTVFRQHVHAKGSLSQAHCKANWSQWCNLYLLQPCRQVSHSNPTALVCQVVFDKKNVQMLEPKENPIWVTEVNHIWLLMIIKCSFGLALPFFSPTGFLFPHLCLSSHPLHLPLAPTLHPYPPSPFITSWFVCFIFPLPHLDNIQCPGRWQQCYVMLHLSLDICVLLLLCYPPLHNTQLKESRLSFTVTCSICRGGGGDGTSAWAPLGVNTPHSGLCWFNSFQLLSALFVYTGCLKQLEQGPGWSSRGIYFCVVWPIASCRVIFVSHINQRLEQDLENKYVDTYINSEAW